MAHVSQLHSTETKTVQHPHVSVAVHSTETHPHVSIAVEQLRHNNMTQQG
jgi:hypothetical protein